MTLGMLTVPTFCRKDLKEKSIFSFLVLSFVIVGKVYSMRVFNDTKNMQRGGELEGKAGVKIKD
jgi:hypothetical protein